MLESLSSMCKDTEYAGAIEEIVELVDDIEYEEAYTKASHLMEELD